MDFEVGDVVKCVSPGGGLVLDKTYTVREIGSLLLTVADEYGTIGAYVCSRFVKVSDADQNDTPAHYDMPMSPLDFIMANKLPFAEGCIIKYVSRYKRKGGKEDLLKARAYLDRLIKEYGDE